MQVTVSLTLLIIRIFQFQFISVHPILFVVKNIDEFTTNSTVHPINTRQRTDLHPPLIKVSKYQKGVYYSGIKIFNYLPQNIKDLSGNAKKFKVALKRFLSMGSFYSLDEYFDWISRTDLSAFI